MSFGNRLHNVTITGCLIAAFLSSMSAPSAQENTQQQNQTPPSHETQNNPEAPLADPLPRVGTPDREKMVEFDWNKPKCGAAQNHDEADLCEQRKMAEAAQDTVWWTRASVLVGTVGTIFLVWNLYYVRRSTDAAVKAYVAEHRAWISVKLALKGDLVIERSGGLAIEVEVEIRNTGNSPAIHVHTNMDVAMSYADAPKILREFCKKNRRVDIYASRLLLAGDAYKRPWCITITPDEIEKVRLGKSLTPVIIGCVTYQVLQDESLHQTAFAYALVRGHGDDFYGLIDPDVTENIDMLGLALHVSTGGFAD